MTHPTPRGPLVPPDQAAKPSLLHRLRSCIYRNTKAEDGTAALEFVLAVPIVMMIFMASIESGVLMTRFIMMEQSVDRVMRNLRLGQYPTPTVELLKQEICSRSVILQGCEANITIEMQPISTTSWALPNGTVECVDRDSDVQPALTFKPGTPHQIMLVRVCMIQDAMFPTTGLGLKLAKDEQGGYSLVATSAFVNEP